jgi:hypothetical protein
MGPGLSKSARLGAKRDEVLRQNEQARIMRQAAARGHM